MSSDQGSGVVVHADIASCFTYASFQNAIPVIRSISIENNGAEMIEALELRLASNPPFLRSRSWRLDRVLAGERLPVSERRVEMDAAYLAGLNEAGRGEVR